MSERTCEGCRWWRYDMQYHGKPHGVCRRNPPVGGEFPEASGDSMCGEWADKTITPEQAERQELVRRFALAIVDGWYASGSNADPDRFVWPDEEPEDVWERAERIVNAEFTKDKGQS